MKSSTTYRMFASSAALLAWAITSHGLPVTNELLSIAAPWHYTTNSVDTENWTSPAYDDSTWQGPGNSLFYIESATLPAAKSTSLPTRTGGGPLPCYYFRTTFAVTSLNELAVLKTDHLTDDGAVFYLNGTEIQRVRMDAGTVSYTTEANDTPGSGDASAFDTFSLRGSALTNLITGTNTLAARVHQHGTDSSDVVFGCRVSAIYDPDAIALLTRGPYLQVCTPTSIRIRWRTDLPESSTVRCGAQPSGLSATYGDAAETAEHEVLVTNLQPDTLYYYAVGSPARMLAGGDETCSFRTHPLPGTQKPLRVWVTGDAGTADDHAQAVRDAFEVANGGRSVDAWLQLGDNAYNSGTDAEYQSAMFDMYADRLRRTAVWTTIGNHETYSTDPNGLYPYLNNFSMPTEGESGGVPSHTQLYFAFDIGMVHFVSLDLKTSDRSPTGEMATWLKSDLAATTNRWLIVFCHHPPYTKGSHNSDTEIELIEMREHLLPILEAGGADLVLSGHSHAYERSRLMNGHYGYSDSLTDAMVVNRGSGRLGGGSGAYVKPENTTGTLIPNQGTVYAVAGSSGKISGGALNHPVMAVSTNKYGSLVLDITSDQLNAVFLRDTGATNDAFTIVKANYEPVASNRHHQVAANMPSSLLLAAADVNRDTLSFSIVSTPSNGLLSTFDAATGAFTYTPARNSANEDSFSFQASDGRLASQPGVVTLSVQAPTDSNANGLPDEWEAQHGLSNPSADPDHDGANNLQEYLAGTDPNDMHSWLSVTQCRHETSGFQIAWSSSGGVRYRVLYSDGDAQGRFDGAFKPLPRPVSEEMDPRPSGTPGTLSYTDDLSVTGVPANGCRYYRISVVQ